MYPRIDFKTSCETLPHLEQMLSSMQELVWVYWQQGGSEDVRSLAEYVLERARFWQGSSRHTRQRENSRQNILDYREKIDVGGGRSAMVSSVSV